MKRFTVGLLRNAWRVVIGNIEVNIDWTGQTELYSLSTFHCDGIVCVDTLEQVD